jgi:flagellar basal body P-ring protein FlgI
VAIRFAVRITRAVVGLGPMHTSSRSAVAQGSVAISGFSAEGDASKVTRGVPTVGRIANGALIERDAGRINKLDNPQEAELPLKDTA